MARYQRNECDFSHGAAGSCEKTAPMPLIYTYYFPDGYTLSKQSVQDEDSVCVKKRKVRYESRHSR